MKTSFLHYDSILTGRNKDSRKLGNHTYLVRHANSIAVRLHNTNVVTYHRDGHIILDSGGWKTPITKDRMNTYSPARISQEKGLWYVSYNGTHSVFRDGLALYRGRIVGAKMQDRQTTKQRAGVMIIHRAVESMLPVVDKLGSWAPLRALRVSAEEVVATDRHVMVRMPLDNTVEMPDAPGESVTEVVLVDPDAFKKAISNLPRKSYLPCSEYIQVSRIGEQYVVNSGVPAVSFPVTCEQEEYPDYKACILDYTNKHPLRFALSGKLLRKICDIAVKYGDGCEGRITFELPTTELKVQVEENSADPVLDENDDPVFEHAPIERIATGVKFVIAGRDVEEAFTGIIMPLRIAD